MLFFIVCIAKASGTSSLDKYLSASLFINSSLSILETSIQDPSPIATTLEVIATTEFSSKEEILSSRSNKSSLGGIKSLVLIALIITSQLYRKAIQEVCDEIVNDYNVLNQKYETYSSDINLYHISQHFF